MCRTLNYFENFLLVVSAVSGCFPISTFVLLVCTPVGIASSAVGFQICALNAGLKKIS